MNNIWILAASEEGITSEPVGSEETTTVQVSSDPNAAPAKTPRGSPFGGYQNLVFIGLIFVMFYFLLFRAPRKKQQQHKQMVQSLQKNDKVRTIGGIIATVVDIRDDEITLKVDESNNIKIKVASSAIGTKLSKENRS